MLAVYLIWLVMTVVALYFVVLGRVGKGIRR
jgi:hypothetical protein